MDNQTTTFGIAPWEPAGANTDNERTQRKIIHGNFNPALHVPSKQRNALLGSSEHPLTIRTAALAFSHYGRLAPCSPISDDAGVLKAKQLDNRGSRASSKHYHRRRTQTSVRLVIGMQSGDAASQLLRDVKACRQTQSLGHNILQRYPATLNDYSTR
jgi:hypothetical protein